MEATAIVTFHHLLQVFFSDLFWWNILCLSVGRSEVVWFPRGLSPHIHSLWPDILDSNHDGGLPPQEHQPAEGGGGTMREIEHIGD